MSSAMASQTADAQFQSNTFYTQKADFWETYLKGRPTPPASFFSTIFDYHRQHGGHFGTVHDVGAGPGPHTRSISEPFQKVLVSDIGESNIQIAEQHLATLEKEVVFKTAKAEDSSWIEPGSVDLIFACTMMHWTDFEPTLAAFDRQLKAGGSLVVAMFGTPGFYDARVQDVFFRLFQHMGEKLFIKVPWEVDAEERRKRLLTWGMKSMGLEAMPLPTSWLEEGAARYYFNHPEGFCWRRVAMSEADEKRAGRVIGIGETDREVWEEWEREKWEFEIDLKGLETILRTYPVCYEDEDWNHFWKEFSDLIGDGTTKGVWPLILIMATKRK